MIDVNKLKEMAHAATPGPWQVGNKIARFVYANDDTPICECDSIGESANREAATAAFIAAANPAVVLELIETQRVLVEAVRDMLGGWRYIRSTHGDLYGVGWDRAQDKAEAAYKRATGE